MTREELEHIIRASGDITNQYEFVIIGSQSILGPIPNPPKVFSVSMEADIYPLNDPTLAEKIEGAIGEGSHFHQTFGYYAEGVGPDTAILPKDWLSRVHRIQTQATENKIGYCLDVVDLFLSKAVASRSKDREFCIALIAHGFVEIEKAIQLVPIMPLDAKEQKRFVATIRRWALAGKGFMN